MGDVIDLVQARIKRCNEVLESRRHADWSSHGRIGDQRAYRERELLADQLKAVQLSYEDEGVLTRFTECVLQTIEVNLGLRSKAAWPV